MFFVYQCTPSRSAWRPTLVFMTLALTSFATQAQTPIDLKECLGMSEDGARLTCYDRQAGRKAMMTLPASPSVTPGTPEAMPVTSAATPATQQQSDSFLSRYWELNSADKRGTFNYTAYRPNFFLPVREMKSVNHHPSSPTRGTATNLPKYQNGETKLQVSMRSKILENALLPGADLWVAYTQQSTWQLWNHAASAPFRDTNFQPELIYVMPTPAAWQSLPLGWKWRMSQAGLVHQSNGQPDVLSRSWNRVYGLLGLENGNVTASIRLENRLEKSSNQSDDNPDIIHYLGRYETQLTWSPGRSTAALLWRPSLSGRGSVQLDWTYPVFNDRPDGLRWYTQAFHGYGETLLDYNFKQTSLGVGLTIFKF